MKELVEVIAKALVDDPDSVAVSERQDGRTTVIEVRVADSDMGKVIGNCLLYTSPSPRDTR